MKVNTGNAVAIGLAALALVVAGTGTAVAVSNVVQIGDGTTPGRLAKVDAAGRLAVGGATSGINSTAFIFSGTNVLTAKTTATLAVSSLQLISNAQNTGYGASFLAGLVQLTPATASDACSASSPMTRLSLTRVGPGDVRDQTYPAPLLVRPVAGKPYCLGILLSPEGTEPGGYYLPFAQLTAYTVSGTYSGQATAAPTGTQLVTAPFAKAGDNPPGAAPAG